MQRCPVVILVEMVELSDGEIIDATLSGGVTWVKKKNDKNDSTLCEAASTAHDNDNSTVHDRVERFDR